MGRAGLTVIAGLAGVALIGLGLLMIFGAVLVGGLSAFGGTGGGATTSPYGLGGAGVGAVVLGVVLLAAASRLGSTPLTRRSAASALLVLAATSFALWALAQGSGYRSQLAAAAGIFVAAGLVLLLVPGGPPRTSRRCRHCGHDLGDAPGGTVCPVCGARGDL